MLLQYYNNINNIAAIFGAVWDIKSSYLCIMTVKEGINNICFDINVYNLLQIAFRADKQMCVHIILK